jgi:hypothetical protein
MRRQIGLIIISAVAAVVATQVLAPHPTSAALTRPPAMIAVLGPRVAVPPGRFVRAFAMCPVGYRVTGGGAYGGAINEIISSPLVSLRGWFVDGTNTDRAGRTFSQRADAVCLRLRGSTAATASAAGGWSSGSSRRGFERAFTTSRRREH